VARHSGKSATQAIEVSVPGEIAALTSKTTPVDADNLIIEDSASSPANGKKRLTWANLRATLAGVLAPAAHNHVQVDITDLDHTDVHAIHTDEAAEVSGLTAKTTPVDADVIPIEDSATTPTAFGKKKLTWAQLKATLAGALAPAAHNHVQVDITDLDHTDVRAIHTDEAAEVSGLTAKTTPVDADVIPIEDSATTPTAFGKKKLTWAQLKATLAGALAPAAHNHVQVDITDLDHTDTDALHDNEAAEISALTAKATPVDADVMVIEDSETTPTAFGKKKATIAALKTVFATAGTDAAAIHDDTAGEIAAVAEKATPVAADLVLIEDSESTNAKKRTTAQAIAGTLAAASTSAAGKVELAETSEVNTGTDAARAVTPDALAGSVLGTKTVVLDLFDFDETVTTGDGKAYFVVPIELNGMNLVSIGGHVFTVSSSGTPTVQVHNLTDTVDMLSTLLTVDASENDSKDATAAAVIDAAHDDVATGDVLRFDVDVAGTGTKGFQVRLGFRLP